MLVEPPPPLDPLVRKFRRRRNVPPLPRLRLIWRANGGDDLNTLLGSLHSGVHSSISMHFWLVERLTRDVCMKLLLSTVVRPNFNFRWVGSATALLYLRVSLDVAWVHISMYLLCIVHPLFLTSSIHLIRSNQSALCKKCLNKGDFGDDID